MMAEMCKQLEEEEEEEKEEGIGRNPPPPAPDCPICYEPMVPPTRIFQCGAGHLVCGGCRPKIQVFTSWEIRNIFFKVQTIFISGVPKQMRSSSWRTCSRNGKLCCPNQKTFLEILKYIIQILSMLLKQEAYCTHCKRLAWAAQCHFHQCRDLFRILISVTNAPK